PYTTYRFKGRTPGEHTLRFHVRTEHTEAYMAAECPAERLMDPLPWDAQYYVSTYRYDDGYRWSIHLHDAHDRLTTCVRGLRTYADRDAAEDGAFDYANTQSWRLTPLATLLQETL